MLNLGLEAFLGGVQTNYGAAAGKILLNLGQEVRVCT